MAENSKIEWCDHTVNLWWGCSKVHTGCKNCYAERLSNRYNNDIWGEDKPRKVIKSAFPDLDKYQHQAKKDNKSVKVFMGSMMDIFEDSKPLLNTPKGDIIDETKYLRMEIFTRISEGFYNNLIFLFLTKRPESIFDLVSHRWNVRQPKNVWFGTSISDEDTKYNANILSRSVTGNKFLSIEPQVGNIDNLDLSNIDWVIQGGESGPNKRPFDIKWAYRMRDICKEQNTPYFFKQIDKIQPIPEDLMIKEYPIFP